MEENYSKKKTVRSLIFLLPLFVILVISIIYLIDLSKGDRKTDKPEQAVEQDTETDETAIMEIEESTIFNYQNDPAYEGANFFEDLNTLEGEPVYIAHPLQIDTEQPPSIIVYSHGSITNITHNMEDPFMKDEMREYGKFFTEKNFIFVASNQHGANWGSPEAVQDTKNLIDYINTTYQTDGKIYMIGFSMGGLPTWNYMFTYPENIVKAALLAPTSYYSTYTAEDFEAISNIEVQIWHGTADVNIGISMSRELVARAKLFNKEVVLNELVGKTHWDVDTELMEEIYQYLSR